MGEQEIFKLLEAVSKGSLSAAEALKKLKDLPYENLGFARVDHHRQLRQGFPEVIFCQGKTEEQVVSVFESLAASGNTVLATRAGAALYEAVKKQFPAAVYHAQARAIVLSAAEEKEPGGLVAVITAGTADIPVAEEAALTATLLGSRVEKLYDVGVAGLHRLLDNLAVINKARAIVVVAGMEGALASVVGGLAACPVVAVPTSVGYGANFGGLAPLLTMLNSCATGVAVVNIDNGFGAGYMAALINQAGENY